MAIGMRPAMSNLAFRAGLHLRTTLSLSFPGDGTWETSTRVRVTPSFCGRLKTRMYGKAHLMPFFTIMCKDSVGWVGWRDCPEHSITACQHKSYDYDLGLLADEEKCDKTCPPGAQCLYSDQVQEFTGGPPLDITV